MQQEGRNGLMGLNLPLPNQAIIPLMIPRGGGRGIRGCHLHAGLPGGARGNLPLAPGRETTPKQDQANSSQPLLS